MRRENDVSLRAVSRLLSYTREWRIRRAKRFGVKESVEKRASLRARFHARGYAARLCSCEQAHRNESISYLLMNLAKTYSQLLFLMYVSVRNIKSVAPLTVPLLRVKFSLERKILISTLLHHSETCLLKVGISRGCITSHWFPEDVILFLEVNDLF